MIKDVTEKPELTEEDIRNREKRAVLLDKCLEIFSRVQREKHDDILNKTATMTDCLEKMSKELKTWKEKNNF